MGVVVVVIERQWVVVVRQEAEDDQLSDCELRVDVVAVQRRIVERVAVRRRAGDQRLGQMYRRSAVNELFGQYIATTHPPPPIVSQSLPAAMYISCE